ncbi:MAG: peptidoglycan-binding protein [bacterium]|nr:peptidoglycan-binding protein [bacterium]
MARTASGRRTTIVLTFACVCLLFAAPARALTRNITFPVNGAASFRDDFHEPRGADGTREHLGIDIISDKMTPVVAAVDGTVSYVVSPQAVWGYSISIQDSEGYQYRYLHLNNDTLGTDDGAGGEANAYVAGIKRGVKVTAGQHIGWVGDSGNAEATVSHLHFEIRDPSRAAINPYDSLVLAVAQSPNSARIKTGVAPVIAHPSEGNTGVMAGSLYVFTQDLSEGATGEAVRKLQERLQNYGFFTSYITDYFGPITRAAVIRFQVTRGISADGIAGAATRAILNADILPASAPEPPVSALTELSEGDLGEAVRLLQTKLSALGYYKAPVIAVYDPVTREAVRSFQVAMGISPTGSLDMQTAKKVEEEFLRLPVVVQPPPVTPPIPSGSAYVFTLNLAEGSRGEAVRQLQQKLQTLGYFTASATGYFGPITRAAVINFQRARGIDPIGLVGPKTRAALNNL